MGKTSYDISTISTTEASSGASNTNYGIGTANYDNPTFSAEDRDRPLAATEDSSNVIVQIDQSALPIQKEMSKFREMPDPTKEDYMKLAFLIGFPSLFFVVAIVITGVNV